MFSSFTKKHAKYISCPGGQRCHIMVMQVAMKFEYFTMVLMQSFDEPCVHYILVRARPLELTTLSSTNH